MKKILIVASVVSFIEWFNKENIDFLKNDLMCEVHVACNFGYMEDTDVKRTKQYLNRIKGEGVILHPIPFARNPGNRMNLIAYKQLKHIMDSEGFDLIHCHTPVAAMITRIAARKTRRNGTVVMYTCHGFHFHNSSPRKNWLIFYPAEKLLSRFCDYIVTINKEDYNRAKKFHAKNIRYIPGVGVDIDKIRNTRIDKKEYRNSIGVPPDAFMILSVGEMTERKNHKVIIQALGKLQRENVYYVICGKGPLKGYLESLAKNLHISKRVIFLGFRKDIPELCRAADISVFPSKIEGLGLAGIEAMAAGLPLIASNVHGILDYAQNGKTGYVFDPDDIDGFAGAIEKLASDSGLREKMQKACINAVQPFDIKNALNKMWDIYREILLPEQEMP